MRDKSMISSLFEMKVIGTLKLFYSSSCSLRVFYDILNEEVVFQVILKFDNNDFKKFYHCLEIGQLLVCLIASYETLTMCM